MRRFFSKLYGVLSLFFIAFQLPAQYTYLSQPVTVSAQSELSNYFKNYQVFEIDPVIIIKEMTSSEFDGSLRLALGNSYDWQMQLSAKEIRSEGYELKQLTRNGVERLPNIPTPTYLGRMTSGALARMTITENYLSLYIRQSGEEYYLESARRFDARLSDNAFVVYQPIDIRNDAPGKCAVTDTRPGPPHVPHQTNLTEVMTCYRAEIAVAADYSMVEDLGSVEAVALHVINTLFAVAGDWNGAGGFADDVNLELTEQIISSCADCDPWSETTQAGELIVEFRNWAEAGGFYFLNDLGELWTARDICTDADCGTVGLATLNAVCTSSKYHLLEKYENSTASLLRSLTSHEIGHNFSLQHNYENGDGCDLMGRPAYIMDPSNQGATLWSDGGFPCDINNVAALATYLPTLDCIDGCSTNNCPPLLGLVIDEITDTTATLSWSGNGGGNYRAILRDVTNNQFIDTIATTSTTITFDNVMQRCRDYQALVQTQCSNGSFSAYTGVFFETDKTTDMEIVEALILDCDPDLNLYDLRVIVVHGGGNDMGFDLIVNNDTLMPAPEFSGTQQTILLSGLISDGALVTLRVVPKSGGGTDCMGIYQYTAPLGDCSLVMEEDFNDGIPENWEVTSSNKTLSLPYAFQSGGYGRPISAYKVRFDTSFATLGATIDSTDMIYFDDDLITQAAFTGTTSLLSPVMDLRTFTNLTLDFDYMFHRFDDPIIVGFIPNKELDEVSHFTLEVYDGNEWVELLDEGANGCGFVNRWKSGCVQNLSLDLSAYTNEAFQLRFTYTDGEAGLWAGMLAIDNYALMGNFDSSLPVALTHFEGERKGKMALLNWGTASEEDNDYFTLERSTNGRDFNPLAQIKGKGTTTVNTPYFYEDHQPLGGVNYYRLLQTDFDGATQQAGKIVAIDFSKNSNIQIRPNPLNDHSLFLDYSVEEVQNLQISILSTAGRLVKQQLLSTQRGTQQTSVNTTGLANGIYFLQIQSNDQLVTQKLVIAR